MTLRRDGFDLIRSCIEGRQLNLVPNFQSVHGVLKSQESNGQPRREGVFGSVRLNSCNGEDIIIVNKDGDGRSHTI